MYAITYFLGVLSGFLIAVIVALIGLDKTEL